MGCDGGTIPKRHELVRLKQRPEQKDKDMDRSAKWSQCAISQQELTPPVVACELGKLYSKESVLEFLLDRSISDNASHIRNLKDVKELQLTKNSAFENWSAKKLADQYHDVNMAAYVCPVSGLEMNGCYKFCFLWKCGCVLAERAIKEVPSENCHKCGKPFSTDDIIILHPDDETDLPLMQSNMESRREKAKLEKKAKKAQKRGSPESSKKSSPEATSSSTKSETETSNGFKVPDSKKSDSAELPVKKKDDNVDVPTKKAKVDIDHKSNGHEKSKKSGKHKADDKSKKLAENPTSSKVYKGLFTSGQKRPKDQSAHWITYNPYHL